MSLGETFDALYALVSTASTVWLVFTEGRPWYRGSVRGWAGGSGRLDVAARVYIAACHGRNGAVVRGCLVGVELQGPSLLLLWPTGACSSEACVARRVLECLAKGWAEGCLFVPGIDGREFVGLALSAGFEPLLLLEDCRLSWRISLHKRIVLLGGSVDPPEWVRRAAWTCVSVGPGSYLASSVAAMLRFLDGLDP